MQQKVNWWIVFTCLSVITAGQFAGESKLDSVAAGSGDRPVKGKDTSQRSYVDEYLRTSRCKYDWNPYEYREDYWSLHRSHASGQKFADTKGNIPDPFLMQESVFPETAHSWKLDCDSGLAHFDCYTDARSVCDAFCTRQCLDHFSGHKSQQEFKDVLKEVGADGCIYRILEVVALKTSVCRAEISYQFKILDAAPTNSTATVYLLEPDWDVVPLANYRRLRKAALTLPLAEKFKFDPEIPTDFGNFIKATDLFDMNNCTVSPSRFPYFYADLQMNGLFRTHFGAVYSFDPQGDDQPGGTYTSDISYLLRPSMLASLGGLPKQFIIWWPGIQPLLQGENGGFSTEARLKMVFQLPPSRYFSGAGMFTIDDERCKVSRPDF